MRIGPSYISVDWSRCVQCCACVSACDRQAIQKAVVPERGVPVAAVVSDTSRVVVGSRAEAKAVRRAAKQAAKARGKSVAYAGKPVAVVGRPAGAGAGVTNTPAAGIAAASPVAASASGGAVATDARTVAREAPASRPTFQRPVVERKPFVPGAVAWGGTDLFVVLAMMLTTVLVKDAALGLPAVGLMPPAGRTVVRAAVLGVYYSLQLAVFAWLATRHGETLSAAFGLGGRTQPAGGAKDDDAPSAAGSVGLVLLLFAGAEVFAIAYGLAMQSVGLTQPLRLSSDLAEVFGSGGAGLALSVVLVALVAPFAEELAFRGVVLPVVGARWGMWPAIVVSAAVYAIYHFSAWLFAPTFVLGVALGWLAWNRRSLVPAIWLHVLYNAAAVAAGFLVAR